MDLTSQLTALKSQSRDLPVNQRAELACGVAKQLEKAGEYEAAYEALSEFWPRRDAEPEVAGLDESTKAEVLLRVGSLAGWLDSTHQSDGSQEIAKNLITRSVELFEGLGRTREVADARSELALCYWREGAYDEARINLRNALALLGDEDSSELRAKLLIRASIVEMQAQKLQEAMQYCDKASAIVEDIEDHALKGSFHIQYGLVLRQLATPENREDYLDRALIEYAAASFHFEHAGNIRYLARVENNLGYLLFTIKRYRDAHDHLNRARTLFTELRGVGDVAQVDETRARTLLAEGRLPEAERVIRSAVKTLERGGQQAVLAEALTTHGTVKARLGKFARARLMLDRAIETAQTAGDLEGAGRAHLSIIEELGGHTPLKELPQIYRSAAELLDRSQDPATNKRLITCACRVIEALSAEDESLTSAGIDSWEGFSLRREINRLEKSLLERALRDAGGSVTRAAKLLGFNHHQSLIALLETRHKDLHDQRSAVRKRRRHLFSKPKRSEKRIPLEQSKTAASKISILHVEDNRPVARVVEELLVAQGFKVETCVNGLAAWEILKTNAAYDVLIVDNNLPGVSGLELVLRARSIPHRRSLPIIMLSGDDIEREAWRAGVDAFVHKPKAVDQLPLTIARVLEEHREK